MAFHPLLSIFEVALRNRLSEVIASHFHDYDWILNEKGGFMASPTLSRSGKAGFLLTEVSKAENRLRRNGMAITSGKVMAEQSLGFWTALLDTRHYKLLAGCPIQAFTPLPAGVGRKHINQELEAVRLFRNRIFHNEPICFYGAAVDFSDALRIHQALSDMMRLMGQDLFQLASELDKVQEEVNSASSI